MISKERDTIGSKHIENLHTLLDRAVGFHIGAKRHSGFEKDING
jgi:hypothetical protein